MPKILLLPVDGSPAGGRVFATALSMGRPFDAHFVALHVRPDIGRDIAAMAATDGGMAAGIQTAIANMEAEAEARETAALAAWLEFCSANAIVAADQPRPGGMTAEWAGEIGVEADWLAEYGRTADLIVVGRGGEDWGPDYPLMEAALMNTGKPVAIAPAGAPAGGAAAPYGGHVGIAWKDTREAAGAVRAAIPYIRAAQRVTIFTVGEGDPDDKSPLRLARMLRWHNPNVAVHPLPGHSRAPAEVLLEAATQAGCGLLAMGAYGHTRLREAVFGGFTRAVLESAPLTLLMAH